MSFLKHWPEDANLANVFGADIDLYYPHARFVDALMRGPSSLSNRQRELIMAYVSALNECQFCVRSHWAAAGGNATPGLEISALVNNLDGTPLRQELKVLLRLARRITLARKP